MHRPLSARPVATLAIAALALTASATVAHADPPPNLPQNATGIEQSFSPAYDYDGDGCYATPAIGPDGTIAPGLNIGGAVNGNCRDQWDLDNSQTYSREKCNNGWCAVMYASYFEKDQTMDGPIAIGSHKHDWEHVVVWVNQASNQVEHVSITEHSGSATYPRSQVRFEGSHPRSSSTRTARAPTCSGWRTVTTTRPRTTTAAGATRRSWAGTAGPALRSATAS